MRIYRIRYFDKHSAENKSEEFTGPNAYTMAKHRTDLIKNNFGWNVIISYFTETFVVSNE